MPENRDQGIGLNGSVKNGIVAVFIVFPLRLHTLYQLSTEQNNRSVSV